MAHCFIGSRLPSRQSIQPVMVLDAIVYFDIETTGLRSDSHILQLAALCEMQTFNVYVDSDQPINAGAKEVHGLRHYNNHLYLQNQRLNTVNIHQALTMFCDFLKSLQAFRVTLVAHNVSFDAPRLVRAMINTGLINEFPMIHGFSDTLQLFRTTMPDRRGQGAFTLENLARDFLGQPAGMYFHNALSDVETLQKLIFRFNLINRLKDNVIPLDYYQQNVLEGLM